MQLVRDETLSHIVRVLLRSGTGRPAPAGHCVDYARFMKALERQGALGGRLMFLFRDFGFNPQLRLATILDVVRHQLPELYAPLMQTLCALHPPAMPYTRPEGVVVGNVTVDGDLHVERPFMVLGNLTVRGHLSDAGASSIIAVSGNLRAQSVITHGDIVVRGNLDAGHLLYGFCNDTTLLVEGCLRAEVLIEDDHAAQAGALRCRHHFDNIHFDRYDERLAAYFVPEAFAVSDRGDRYLSHTQLAGLLAEGKGLLRRGG